jgi:hypothetical protein
MLNIGRRIISVTFVEQASGTIISPVRQPLERLPATFAPDQELKMAGKTYIALTVRPPTKAEFADTKALKVLLRERRS